MAAAAICFCALPQATYLELSAPSASEWLGKTTGSLALGKMTSGCCTLIGKLASNGAILAVDPVTIAAAAATGGAMNGIGALVSMGTYGETLESKVYDVREQALTPALTSSNATTS